MMGSEALKFCIDNIKFKVPQLNYDNGDIEKVSEWFPVGYNYQNFNGNILEYNWN